MQLSRHLNRFRWDRFTRFWPQVDRQRAVPDFRYRQILVPVSLKPADCGSLVLGFELAALHNAELTLLHVLPPAKRGLNAFDLLHNAVDELRRLSPGRQPCDAARSEVRAFINDVAPAQLLSEVCWREECRPGELSEAVVAEANESAADLVILSATALRWWMPQIFDTWAIRRRTRASVILFRQPANAFAI